MDLQKMARLTKPMSKEALAELDELQRLIDDGKPLPKKYSCFELVDKDTYRLKGKDGKWRTYKF